MRCCISYVKNMEEKIKKLEELRKTLGMSVQEFCDCLGIPRSTRIRWLSDKKKKINPSMEIHIDRLIDDLQKQARPLEDKIVEKLLDCYICFLPHEISGLEIEQGDETGFLHIFFTLSLLRNELKVNYIQILEALERLAITGRIKIFKVEITSEMLINDCGIAAELGTAVRVAGVGTGCRDYLLSQKEIKPIRLYKNKPLTKSEMKEPHCLFSIKELAEKAIAEGMKTIIKRHGPSDGWKVERELRREEREDELDLQKVLIKSGKMEKK